MRWFVALAVFTALIAGVFVAGSCLVDRRTNELSCNDNTDCPDGRICDTGFCITGSVPVDLPPPVTCADSDCASMGGSCNGETCTFSCSAATCPGIVTCPDGVACQVTCSGAGACSTGVACAGSLACTINCDAGACQAPLDCGGGDCTVNCTGANACANEVRCAQANRCIVNCTGSDTCGGRVQCGGACDVNCDGDRSCAMGTACGNACFCDVDCVGVNACAASSACGKSQCNEPPGCDPTNNGCNPSCAAP